MQSAELNGSLNSPTFFPINTHKQQISGTLDEIMLCNVFLPPRASEQGNVIGSVRIYMCVQKKIVIERTRDLIYLKFVATDFFPKIISLSAGENSGDLA